MSTNPEVLQTWETNAAYWDAGIGVGGNKYWKKLQEPCLTRLLASRLSQPGCQALDLATGNGLCARWMASHGAQVLATDGSHAMLEIAKGHSERSMIEFKKLDFNQADEWEAVVEKAVMMGGFDVVLCNMAIMDIPDIDILARMLPMLLKKEGAFVATLLHPAYWTNNASRNIEVKYNTETGDREVVLSRVVKEYLHVPPVKGIAVPGQPVAQVYFHRPLHELFGVFFRNGLVMDALEEPAFTAADAVEARLEASSNYTQIPAILAFRMRKSF